MPDTGGGNGAANDAAVVAFDNTEGKPGDPEAQAAEEHATEVAAARRAVAKAKDQLDAAKASLAALTKEN